MWRVVVLLSIALCSGFEEYDEVQMQNQFKNALATVKQILNTTRHPQFPADVPHTYEDKYALVEFLTNTALAAELNALDAMGLNAEKLAKMQKWSSAKRAVNIGFRARQSCTFLRNESQQVGGPQTVVKVTSGKSETTATKQTFTDVVSYYYNSSLSWQLIIYPGTESKSSDTALVLDSRNTSFEMKTSFNSPPSACRSNALPNTDVELTWLFENLDANGRPKFAVDRGAKACHTPRRNPQVDDAYDFFTSMNDWTQNALSRIPSWDKVALSNPIFVPVVPLFEKVCNTTSNATDCDSPRVVLSASDLNAFLGEQQSSLRAAAEQARTTYPARSNSTAQLSEVEARLAGSLIHQSQIVEAFAVGVDSVEGMLSAQLIAAIGKEVSPNDFGEYVRFNNKRLFKPEYAPQELSYSVRRPDHYPEGVVEVRYEGAPSFPIQSFVRVDRPVNGPMNSTLAGGTRISLNGERYLHAAIFYNFAGQSDLRLQLAARARQFSSFVLLVGTLVSANEFRADIGLIIKDKDDLAIPLMLSTIPTPKQFRDAIESLSPEQRAFAKAFRSMQLSSTLFAFAIVQVKPQLEKLMKLPEDSLTKEIQLTQDLMRLFLEYQIPSDLLSFQGDNDLAAVDKIAYVKAQVGQMNKFIEAEKQLQIKEEEMRRNMTMQEERKWTKLNFQTFSLDKAEMEDDAPMAEDFMGAFAPPPRPVRVPAPVPLASPITPAQRTVNTPSSSSSTSSSSSSSSSSASSSTPATPAQTTTTTNTTSSTRPGKVLDYTTIPTLLDARVLELDENSSLRAAILKPGDTWTRQSQKGLLGDRTSATLWESDQTDERQKAFDLLEALSKSGIMAFDAAEFHVVIGSSQGFEDTLLDTVIQDNLNPFDQFERSSLIVASTVLGKPPQELVASQQIPRLAAFSPRLFPDASSTHDQ